MSHHATIRDAVIQARREAGGDGNVYVFNRCRAATCVAPDCDCERTCLTPDDPRSIEEMLAAVVTN